MNRIAGITHALLRIVSGFLFIHPGGMKLLGWFGGMPPGVEMTPLITAAGVIELVAGFLIMIGLFTRPAAFIASGEMAFAYFIGHFHQGFWPIVNQGQPAVLYCFIFLFLWGNGPGPFSVDGWLRHRRTAASPDSPIRQEHREPAAR
ncbi:MAG TPA: DoxX family protein [Candidatus Eisenbacteria bacterium]|nr:DoxX family protein [Candidatus Eisenbacteria bacterium]